MTDAQKVSAIKRINERLQDLRRAVKDDQIPKTALKKFEAAIETSIKAPLTKQGLISHGKAALAAIKDEVLEALSKHRTAGQIKKKLRRGAVEYYDHKPTQDEYKAYIDIVETVEEAAAELPGELSDAIKAYGSAARQGSRTSYKVLKAALDAFRNDTEETARTVETAKVGDELRAFGL